MNIKKYKENPIIQLIMGSLLAQIITISVSPISTRLFTKEELGLYTLVLTVISIFGPVLCGRYEMAIVTSSSKEKEMQLVYVSLIIGIISSIIITLVYGTYLYFEKDIIEQTGYVLLFLVFVMLVMTALSNVLVAYNNKNKEYGTISRVYVIRNFIQSLFLIITGFFKWGSVGLLFSQTIASFFGIAKQSEGLMKDKVLLFKTKRKDVKNILIEEKKQPIYSVPATLLNTSAYSILNFFITMLYGLKTFGLYSMSYRILGLPLALISTNMSKVYFQEASDEKLVKGNYINSLKKHSFILIVIAIPMVIGMMVLAPLAFEFLFGSGWGVSGQYVRILAPMYGIRFVVSSVIVSLTISKRQEIELYLQSTFIISSFLVFLMCKFNNYNEFLFLKGIAATYIIIYLIFYIVILKLSMKK